jgi:RimJ/RimL family protein N-acetyltransferase
MDRSALGITARCLPRTFASKNGLRCELQLLPCGKGDRSNLCEAGHRPKVGRGPFRQIGPVPFSADGQRLVDMYLGFQPRNCFQGLPPLKDAACVQWVHDMLRTGVNVIAQCNPHGIIGHTALFPISRQKCEMLVVVCPGFQNVGIGTELVRSCIELAGERGFERIWLPVESTNVRARHVYRKCGFEYVSNQQGREMDMACDVRRNRLIVADAGQPAGPVPAPCFHFPALAALWPGDSSRR